MLTYQVRPRGCYTEPLGVELTFPADVEVTFHLLPRYPLGGPPEACDTALRGDTVRLCFNSNTGTCIGEPQAPMPNVAVSSGQVEVNGPQVTVRKRCDTREELEGLLEGYHYLLPLALNVEMLDAPVIELVAGRVGATKFHWGVTRPDGHKFDVTTPEKQAARVLGALQRLEELGKDADGSRRRLLAALHWFHVACRLRRVGNSPWEFLSEVLVNYAKILEVLFPAEIGLGTIDAARKGLADLGVAKQEIEHNYVPAIALRNSIDVAHASLAVFSQDELAVLHAYTEAAQPAFRSLIDRVVKQVLSGASSLAPYEGGRPSTAALKIVERLKAAQSA